MSSWTFTQNLGVEGGVGGCAEVEGLQMREELHLGGGGAARVGGSYVWMEGEPKLIGRAESIDGREGKLWRNERSCV